MTRTPKPIKKLYYSIGEVSRMLDLKPYVLRYWETEFSQLSPPKNKAGNRIYRQKEVDLLRHIKELLYERKYTIEGARRQLAEEQTTKESPAEEVTATPPPPVPKVDRNLLLKVRQELETVLDTVRGG